MLVSARISSYDSAIIEDADQVLSLCGVCLGLVASRMTLLVEDVGLQPVEETTGSARVNAPASPVVADLPGNSKQCQPACCSLVPTFLREGVVIQGRVIPEAREIHLLRKDRKVLEARCRSPVTWQRDLKRARMVLLAAAGRSPRSIASEVGGQPRIVSFWRHRYAGPLKGCKTSRGLAPEKAIVPCVDEKPSIQALERAQGYLKLPNGRALTGQSHAYRRAWHDNVVCGA